MNPKRKRVLSLIVSLLLLFSLVPVSASAASNVPYKDIDDTHWSWPYASWAYENDIMYGVSKDRFAPQEEITRAMAVTVLYRLSGEKSSETTEKFDDIDPQAYYAEAAGWAEKAGIIKGTSENTFSPDNSLYRQDFAVMLYRYDHYKSNIPYEEPTITEYPEDLTIQLWKRNILNLISAYAEDAVNWTVSNYIIKGTYNDGRYSLFPFSYHNRGEIAAMIQRYEEADTTIKETVFNIDINDVANIDTLKSSPPSRITYNKSEDIKELVDKLNGFDYNKKYAHRDAPALYGIEIRYKSGQKVVFAVNNYGIDINGFTYQNDDRDNPSDYNIYFTQDWIDKWFPADTNPNP